MNKLTPSNSKKSQVISLSKARSMNRSKHISSLIDSIQDDGPANQSSTTRKVRTVSKTKKAPLVMITRTPGINPQPQTVEPPAAAKEKPRKSFLVSAILFVALVLSSSAYAIFSLNTRITNLEQQIILLQE